MDGYTCTVIGYGKITRNFFFDVMILWYVLIRLWSRMIIWHLFKVKSQPTFLVGIIFTVSQSLRVKIENPCCTYWSKISIIGQFMSIGHKNKWIKAFISINIALALALLNAYNQTETEDMTNDKLFRLSNLIINGLRHEHIESHYLQHLLQRKTVWVVDQRYFTFVYRYCLLQNNNMRFWYPSKCNCCLFILVGTILFFIRKNLERTSSMCLNMVTNGVHVFIQSIMWQLN